MLDYFLLGILQGVFEWLPVSSEGILTLVSMFSIQNPIDLAIFLHLGTTLSAIFYFRNELWDILTFRNKKLLMFVVISTIVSLVIAFPIYLFLSGISAYYGLFLLLVIGIALFVTGIVLKRSEERGKKSIDELTRKEAAIVGILQGIAVIPGLSRSATTITGLLLLGVEQETALKLSFIMSIPVVIAANIFFVLKGVTFELGYLLALLTSFVVGILSMHVLITFSRKVDFTLFCWVLGALATATFLFVVFFNV